MSEEVPEMGDLRQVRCPLQRLPVARQKDTGIDAQLPQCAGQGRGNIRQPPRFDQGIDL